MRLPYNHSGKLELKRRRLPQKGRTTQTKDKDHPSTTTTTPVLFLPRATIATAAAEVEYDFDVPVVSPREARACPSWIIQKVLLLFLRQRPCRRRHPANEPEPKLATRRAFAGDFRSNYFSHLVWVQTTVVEEIALESKRKVVFDKRIAAPGNRSDER